MAWLWVFGFWCGYGFRYFGGPRPEKLSRRQRKERELGRIIAQRADGLGRHRSFVGPGMKISWGGLIDFDGREIYLEISEADE